MKQIIRVAALLLIVLTAGCGYHFPARGGGVLPGGVKSINIPAIANKSYRANLETIIHRNVVDEFQNMRGFNVLTGSDADATIVSSVVSYATSAVSYSGTDTVREYRATVVLDSVLRQNGTNKVLWKGSVTAWHDFPANTNIAVQQNNEDAAIQELARKTAQQLYIKINEDF